MLKFLKTQLVLAFAGTLIPADVLNQVAAAGGGDDMFDKMIAGKWLPRLQLMTSNSTKCKSGEFPVNHYALAVGTTLADLGKEPDVLVLAYRFKALDTSGDNIISVYDPASSEWARIAEKADNTKDSGCMYGPEFLMYIPSQKKFATFLMGSKSSRRESPDVKARVGQAATMGSRLAEKGTYSWMVPICKPCSTPFDLPPMDEIKDQISKFVNPPAQEVEAAPAETSGRER